MTHMYGEPLAGANRAAIFFSGAVSHSRGGRRRSLVHVPMSIATKPAVLGPFDPDLRSALIAMVRKRVPDSEVEDIVQQALAEAIESPHAPQDSESLRRWIFGVAKNKVVDYHRRAGRESFDLPDVEGTPAPHVEADLLRWAEKNLPEGAENKKTLDWMLREGEGEKLESIAASEKLPPPRVRQRVSRLRRHFKENWQREVAMLAALGVIVSAIVIFIMKRSEPEPIVRDVVDPRAEPVRRLALEKCGSGEWKPCLEGLDEARRLDPAGEARPEVRKARQAAEQMLQAPPAPSALPTTAPPELAPSSNVAPTPSPIDSAFDKVMRKTGPAKPQAPAKPQSTESFTPTPAPVPTLVPTAANIPPSIAPEPSKQDSFGTGSPAPAKPQGKKAAPSKAVSDFIEPGSAGSFTPPRQTKGGTRGGSNTK
jgi:DNA-directed RNA polymerase specialized sigma24 family protein